jgi:hypothetical protein
MAREAGHAELEIHLALLRGATGICGYGGTAGGGSHCKRAKSHERTAIYHSSFSVYRGKRKTSLPRHSRGKSHGLTELAEMTLRV